MAVSEILLGEANAAIGNLLDDERMAMKLRGAAHMSVPKQRPKRPTDYQTETK